MIRRLWLDHTNANFYGMMCINLEDIVTIFECLTRIVVRTTKAGYLGLIYLWGLTIMLPGTGIVKLLNRVRYWLWRGFIVELTKEIPYEEQDIK